MEFGIDHLTRTFFFNYFENFLETERLNTLLAVPNWPIQKDF